MTLEEQLAEATMPAGTNLLAHTGLVPAEFARQLMLELKQYKKDAERYRWLRDEENDMQADLRLCIFDDGGVMLSGVEFDNEIDDAIATWLTRRSWGNQ